MIESRLHFYCLCLSFKHRPRSNFFSYVKWTQVNSRPIRESLLSECSKVPWCRSTILLVLSKVDSIRLFVYVNSFIVCISTLCGMVHCTVHVPGIRVQIWVVSTHYSSTIVPGTTPSRYNVQVLWVQQTSWIQREVELHMAYRLVSVYCVEHVVESQTCKHSNIHMTSSRLIPKTSFLTKFLVADSRYNF